MEPADEEFTTPRGVNTVKLRNRISGLRKTYPRIGPSRYLYATRADLKKQGVGIVVLIVLWSDDGRVSLHRTRFTKKQAMNVREWSDWLHANVPDVLRNNVLAYVNRTFGSTWSIDRLFGWHFARGRR